MNTDKNIIPGWMINGELKVLRTLFSRFNYEGAVGVEIGSFLGRSSYEISRAMPLGTLCCMDTWEIYNNWRVPPNHDTHKYDGIRPQENELCSIFTFLKNTKECKNISPIPVKNVNSLKYWTMPVDFLFLDAAHKNPSDKEYIDFWLPKIKPGGILSGHDYHANYPHLKDVYPDIKSNIEWLENKLNQKVKTPDNLSIWYFDI